MDTNIRIYFSRWIIIVLSHIINQESSHFDNVVFRFCFTKTSTTTKIIMQTIAVFVACLAVASATYAVRTPSYDSATIESHRLGGSFAYRTQEGHAYGVVSPVVQNVATPVATSYSAVAGYPYTYNNLNGQLVNGQYINGQLINSQLNNAAVVRSGNLVSGVNGLQYTNLNQLNNVAVVRSGNVVSGLNGIQYTNLNTLNNVGYLPVSSVVV